jgi:glyoxylate/hydroxypyruvate reductase A
VSEVDIIFAGSTFPLDVLHRAKKLKWIQSMGAGVENFIRAGTIPSDVVLTKVRGVFGSIMSEYVIAYILAMTQKMPTVFENKRNKKWSIFLVDSIRQKTVGVMGLGSVGATIAYRVHLTGAETVGYDGQERTLPFVSRVYGPPELDSFLKEVDFLVLALPLTNETEGILGARELDLMKDSAYLVNVARGALVREEALLGALKNRAIAGAVLDVFNEEPLPASHPFWELENVIITPHISGPSIPEEITEIFIRNLKRFEEGAELEGVVDLSRGY